MSLYPMKSTYMDCYSVPIRPMPAWNKQLYNRDVPIKRVSPYTGAGKCWDDRQHGPYEGSAYETPAILPNLSAFTRHTLDEWSKSMLQQFNTAETARNISERVRGESVHLVRQSDDQTRLGTRETGRRLGERINTVSFWMLELRAELERLYQEMAALNDTRRQLERAVAETAKPLSVAQECLLHREKRRGIDLVRDGPEDSLIKEVDTVTAVREKLQMMLDKIIILLGDMRMTQHALDRDYNRKLAAINLDSMCHQMNLSSPGLAHYRGIERMEQSNTMPETYSYSTNDMLMEARNQRVLGSRLRADIDAMINSSAHDVWVAWNNTNASLQQRISEWTNARDKLHMQLAKVNNEIVEQKRHIDLIMKAINDKRSPLQVAQTRLEMRTHRPEIELCCDAAHTRLVKEVQEIQNNAEHLQRKQQEAEDALQSLVRTRARLEEDLRMKANSLFIDKEQCLGMRNSFPYNITVIL